MPLNPIMYGTQPVEPFDGEFDEEAMLAQEEAYEEELASIHEMAMKEFDEIQTAYQDERYQCLEDRRFYSIAGAQWEGAIGEQFENKVKFEVNHIMLGIIRIFSEYMLNKISVDFVNQFGNKDEWLAPTCTGLYRTDEQDSQADEAYDNAYEESIGGGMGAWRLIAVKEDEEDLDNDQQRISFEPIYDADSSVFFDLGCKRQDKSDAKRCYLISMMSEADFAEEFGEENKPSNWPKDITMSEFDWNTPDGIYIAEMYQVEYEHITYEIFEMLDGTTKKYPEEEIENDDDKLFNLLATGATRAGYTTHKVRRIHKYTLSGNGVLRDDGYVAGKYIPIIVTYAKRWVVDGVERCSGHVRPTKDTQRLKNMQISQLGELSAVSPNQKPIFTPKQVKGHELRWADDHIKNYPYMLLNLDEDVPGQQSILGPIGQVTPPSVPPALATLLAQTTDDIKELLGNQEQAEEVAPNLSGYAIERVQGSLDKQSFLYMANFAKAMRWSGVVWLSMAQELYVETGRLMESTDTEGNRTTVELNKPARANTGELIYANDLSQGKLKVFADVGPSSSSRRQATIRNLTNMLPMVTDAETQNVIASLALMNMEGEGVEDARGYFRKKLVKMGVVNPTEQEAKELLETAEPDANETYLKAAAESQLADAEEARSKTVVNLATAEERRANTLTALADIDRNDLDTVIKLLTLVKNTATTGQVSETTGQTSETMMTGGQNG